MEAVYREEQDAKNGDVGELSKDRRAIRSCKLLGSDYPMQATCNG